MCSTWILILFPNSQTSNLKPFNQPIQWTKQDPHNLKPPPPPFPLQISPSHSNEVPTFEPDQIPSQNILLLPLDLLLHPHLLHRPVHRLVVRRHNIPCTDRRCFPLGCIGSRGSTRHRGGLDHGAGAPCLRGEPSPGTCCSGEENHHWSCYVFG